MEVGRVDQWHARWNEVLDALEHVGERDAIKVDADGWLSARQILLVAFAGEAVAGHLCFRVEPTSAVSNSRRTVEAVIDSVGVQPEFDRDEIEPPLRLAAERAARNLRCVGIR